MRTFKSYIRDKRYVSGFKPTYPIIETVFGKHSIENIQEAINSVVEPEYSVTMQNRIHTAAVPINNNILTPDEKSAIISHTGRSYMTNDYLHRHATNKVSGEPPSQIANLDSALDKHSTKIATTVYTGLKHSPSSIFIPNSDGEIPESKIAHFPAYTSTSTSYNVANSFVRPFSRSEDSVVKLPPGKHKHILKIHVPVGTNAMSVRDHASYGNENEILLHRGHNIEINSRPEINHDGTYIWHGKIVSHTLHEV